MDKLTEEQKSQLARGSVMSADPDLVRFAEEIATELADIPKYDTTGTTPDS